MSKDVVIVYTPVGGGHQAAAVALAEGATRRGHSVELIDLFACAPGFIGATYQTAHLQGTTLAPELYGRGYFAANRRDGGFEPLRRGFDLVAFAGLVNRVCALNPHTVIATHHLPLVVLGNARRRGWLKAPLTAVVTDYTTHACWAEPGVDAFCVPCPIAVRELALHGAPWPIIEETGIPIRAAFAAIADVVAPRPDEPLRVLATSGSFGAGPIRSILESFAGLDGIELTVVCGRSSTTADAARRAAEEAQVHARILGFEPDMARRIAEAHVVVGKAGGLTVTETMAAGRPMVLVGTVPGNELSNERMVVRGGAGRAALPRSAGVVVAALREPGLLVEMGRRARRLVHADGTDRVLDVAARGAAVFASGLAA